MTPRPWMTVRKLPFDELLQHLGGIAPERVRLDPPPGKTTEADVDWFDCHEDRLFELIEGVLVEKVYIFFDSIITGNIAFAVGNWNHDRDAGIVTGANGPFRFGPKQVRMPDVAFTKWDRFPGRRRPRKAIPDLVPSLAVETINPANTPGELDRKLHDYFTAGVELVWCADPRRRVVDVFTTAKRRTTLTRRDTLEGGRVLKGFAVSVAQLLDPPRPAKKRRERRG